jgi:hypothetical protein
MIRNYFNYKVKITDKPFVTESGKQYNNTAAISFLDENKKEIAYVECGFIDKEEVYVLIDQQQPINLDYCYIENFSLADHRESRNIEKKSYIKLHQFSAFNSYFDSRVATDFSFAEFDDEYENFENAHFLNGATIFQAVKFNQGGVNFSYSYFNDGNVDFSNVDFGDGEVNFKNSWFGSGHKNFQDASFGEGNVLFMNTEFNNGDVTFVNTIFQSNRVSFKVARFGEGKIGFHFARFHCKELIFERTEFGNGKVDFRTTEFADAKVSFNRAVFGNGEKSFEATQHNEGKLTFRKSVWGDGNISFEQAELDNSMLILDNADFGKGNLSFNNAHIQELSLKSCHLDYYVDLRISKCKFIDLSDTVARDIIDIMPYDFPLHIDTINFSGMRLIGRVYLDWRENNVLKLIYNQKDTSLREKAEQFRILKENFNNAGQYDDEDKAYIQFKRNEAKAVLHESINKHKFSAFWQYPAYTFKMLVFDRMGLYATSPVRVIFSNIIMIFIFSTLFTIIPYISNNHLSPLTENSTFFEKFGTAAYFSAISYFTVGYGDILPQGALFRLIAGCAGFTGVFMMSYFTVAFVRKILR